MQIGEVARRSGVSARMLRHYDALGLVRPSDRSSSGYREYSDDDIRRIFHVESLRSLGLSLKEIGRALDDPQFAPDALVADLIEVTRARISVQERLLERLRVVASTGPDDWEQVLGALSLLAELEAASPAARQRAALGTVGAHAPVDALPEALLRERSTNVTGALQWALAQAPQADVSPLVSALDSPDPTVRDRAVRALARLSGNDGVLRTALRHTDDAVRSVAALALGTRGDEAATPELLRMVVDGRNDIDAAEALGVLAAAGDTETISAALGSAARVTADYTERQRIVQALAEIHTAGADDELTGLATDGDERIARTAAFILRNRAR